MPGQRTIFSPARLRDLLALAAALLLVAVVILWFRSLDGIGDETYLDGSGNRFHFVSRGGYLIVGVFQEEVPTLWAWSRRRSTGISTLIGDPEMLVTASPFGWGIALPHWAAAGLIAVIPAWWWLVRTDQTEKLRRLTHGLCAHCGYDLRASPEYCPECGAKARHGATGGVIIPST